MQRRPTGFRQTCFAGRNDGSRSFRSSCTHRDPRRVLRLEAQQPLIKRQGLLELAGLAKCESLVGERFDMVRLLNEDFIADRARFVESAFFEGLPGPLQTLGSFLFEPADLRPFLSRRFPGACFVTQPLEFGMQLAQVLRATGAPRDGLLVFFATPAELHDQSPGIECAEVDLNRVLRPGHRVLRPAASNRLRRGHAGFVVAALD